MENAAKDRRQTTAVQPVTARKREEEFREAVDRVCRKYGDDLSAFLRDIQKERELARKSWKEARQVIVPHPS